VNRVSILCLGQLGLCQHAQLPGPMICWTSTSWVARITGFNHSTKIATDFL
jgi:hypothetical protein